jgi:hypothetical protein
MEMVLALGETDGPLHVYFNRPGELQQWNDAPGTAYVTFFSPRQEIPERRAPNHYRFPIQPGGVYRSIAALLALLQDEFEGRDVTVHFGWSTSSWIDRMATGVFVWNLLRLPRLFPGLRFEIGHEPTDGRTAPGQQPPGAASPMKVDDSSRRA